MVGAFFVFYDWLRKSIFRLVNNLLPYLLVANLDSGTLCVVCEAVSAKELRYCVMVQCSSQ